MSNSNKSNNPLVSISCLTYNHVNYIREAVEGFLMQKTNFKFEVLIHDDASTDGTEDIIRAYQQKYPTIIKPLYEETNQWNSGRRGSATFNFPRAQGQYIALCEGDDYWTDPLKLQKQVDFLEANEEFVMCGSLATRSYDNPAIPNDIEGEAGIFDQKDLAQRNFIPTATVLFRRICVTDYPKWLTKSPIGDWPLFLICLNHGKIKMFDEQMALRRVHASGVWGSNINAQNNDKNIITLMKMFNIVRDKFTPEINGLLNDNYFKQLIKLINLHLKQHHFDEVAQHLQVLLNEVFHISEDTENMTTAITKKLTLQEQEINDLKMLNTQLMNSKSYKLGRQVTGTFKFLKK